MRTRREFIKTASFGASGLIMSSSRALKTSIPRWRGFNLLSFFQALDKGSRSDGMISRDDCKWIRDWGFDFIRLPLDYWLWIDSDWRKTRKLDLDDLYRIKESTLEKIDRAVDIAREYSLHINLNFHRAPGYCINKPEREPFVLWQDKRVEDAFVYHWDLFAKRYKQVSSSNLSFNLVNEAPRPKPGYMSREDYCRVMTRAVEKIRETSPDRTIIIDGLNVGNTVVHEMILTGVAQSVHAYWPAQISHFKAGWVDRGSRFPEPAWPVLKDDGSIRFDRASLEEHYAPWGALVKKGIGVHCGECGCYNRTPHHVFLAWFRDVMDILKSYNIGYSLWNFRGSFGILDSGRKDVDYEDWHGHKLDRKLLTLLLES